MRASVAPEWILFMFAIGEFLHNRSVPDERGDSILKYSVPWNGNKRQHGDFLENDRKNFGSVSIIYRDDRSE
jgi:hypothetical protein